MATSQGFFTTRHSEDFQPVFVCIAEGIARGATDEEISSRLNDADLRTARGLPFTHNRLAQLLKVLRNPIDYPSRAYRALMELHRRRKMSGAQCRLLLNVRGGAL